MSLKPIFYPKNVAVIGASRQREKIGHNVVENLIKGGFKGKIYPINPSGENILNLKTYKNIRNTPSEVDLAIIIVPAKITPEVMEDCVLQGVHSVIIISAGFSEIGIGGKKLEDEIVKIAERGGIRVVGPNCQGVINMSANLFAWFGALPKKRGNIAFITQSGAYGGGLISWANRAKMGLFNTVVSLGNKCDVDDAELLRYFAEDENIKTITIYMEGVKEGRKFIEVAKNVSKKKPIVTLRAGRSPVGAKAIVSHTGSLASADQIYDAAFKQCGIIRVLSTEEMVDASVALATRSYAYGNNIAIITNAGGPGAIVADSCYDNGLNLSKFSKSTISKLRENLPPQSAIENPIDIIGDPRPERFKIALDAALEDDNVDGAIVIVIGPLKGKIILDAKRTYEKPIVVCWLSREYAWTAPQKLQEKGIPVYEMPERAVHGMFSLVKYGMSLRGQHTAGLRCKEENLISESPLFNQKVL
jgi:acetyl coenzyme A synthetase (ADP forming)-like protein